MGRSVKRVGGRGWREDWKQGTRVGWRKRYTVSYGMDVVKVLLSSSPSDPHPSSLPHSPLLPLSSLLLFHSSPSSPSLFPDLFEERALLLSHLGRHEVALAIYAHVLKEPEMAEE